VEKSFIVSKEEVVVVKITMKNGTNLQTMKKQKKRKKFIEDKEEILTKEEEKLLLEKLKYYGYT
jgi:hypothetical protein